MVGSDVVGRSTSPRRWPARSSRSGYGSLFIPEVGLKDCLVESAALLDATDKLVIGTGIANIHARIPTAAEGGGRTLTALHPGRFVLGLGVSHGPLVENMLGLYL